MLNRRWKAAAAALAAAVVLTAPAARAASVEVDGVTLSREQGWGENGQCMMKMNCRTGAISAVMTNQNPDMGQSESGVEWLVNRNLV